MMDFAIIQYYCHEKCYHTMKIICESYLKKCPDDSVIILQYCAALILENLLGEAIHQLEILIKSKYSVINVAALLSMIYAQSSCEITDEEVITTLEDRLNIEKKRSTEDQLYYAANFCLQVENYEEAREYVQLILHLNVNSNKALLIKGWIDLHDGKSTIAADCFRRVLIQEPDNLQAAIGEVQSSSHDEAITKLNHIIVKYPNSTIPLIEKMKKLLTERDWDLAIDTANRILSMDRNCIIALQFRVIYEIRMCGNYSFLYEDGNEIMSTTIEQEPKNWKINYEFAVLLARICGCNEEAIRHSLKFINEALNVSPNNINLNMELAHHYYLMKNYEKSTEIYKKVARLDDTATEALIGLIKCKIDRGDYNDEIKQQIDFLVDVYDNDSNADLLMLQIIDTDEYNADKLIRKAITLKIKNSDSFPFGFEYLKQLDSTFILSALYKLPNTTGTKAFKIEILRKLTQIIPGLIEAWLQLAEVNLDVENYKEAESVLQHILNNYDKLNSVANLMLARVLIQQKRYEQAESLLDLCLSQNLNIRSKPLFHFLNGKIQKYKNNIQDCMISMETAIKYFTETECLKLVDLASLYLDLSSCYQITRQTNEAAEAIQKATKILEGTAQEDQILMARVELELWKNDINKALVLLSTITINSPLYEEVRSAARACTKIADIHLKYNNDTLKYVKCYKELVDQFPTQENLIKLADAYFSIRKIKESVEIYERTIEKSPNAKLSKKLAELHYKCHQYGKAMKCYRDSGVEGALDLAQLLFRLDNWDKAECALGSVPFLNKVILLSKIKEKQGEISVAINLLSDAYKKCNTSNDVLASQINCRLAELEMSQHNTESAIRNYKLALSHVENNPNEEIAIQMSLSKLYLQLNEWSACQAICSSLLNINPTNEMALLMSADLSFRKCDFSTASSVFSKLLKQDATYWLALVRIIEIKRRLGVLNDAIPYIKNAAESKPNDPALLYCQGLFHWYNNDLHEAKEYFTYVKNDAEWGQQALCNMIEIYLSTNIDGENYEAAELLLKDICPTSLEEESNRNLLVNFVLLASKDKQLIERAMHELTSLATRDVLRVGASLGLAIGYTNQKQAQRARNMLKIVAKTAWQFEEAEYLERCWLMLAEHYVTTNKLELAHDLIKKILAYNAGCGKAYEFYGIIAEKDIKYGDPASYYSKAWNLNGRNDPGLAYRIGYFYHKSKKYADAISICQFTMKKFPDHLTSSKMKKDIYEKAVSLLRI